MLRYCCGVIVIRECGSCRPHTSSNPPVHVVSIWTCDPGLQHSLCFDDSLDCWPRLQIVSGILGSQSNLLTILVQDEWDRNEGDTEKCQRRRSPVYAKIWEHCVCKQRLIYVRGVVSKVGSTHKSGTKHRPEKVITCQHTGSLRWINIREVIEYSWTDVSNGWTSGRKMTYHWTR